MSNKDTTPSAIGRRVWTLVGRRAAARRRRRGAVGMHLQSVDREVLGSLWMWSPTLSVAVVEDACWALARECWLARRPPLWRSAARRAWRAECAQLEAKRLRVVELLDDET